MEIARNNFLSKQLTVLPQDIVLKIRDYDAIYRTMFSKRILKNLQGNVLDFWYKKHQEYMKNDFLFFHEIEEGEIIEPEEEISITNFFKKCDEYVFILQKIIPPLPSFSVDDESYGLLMLD